MEYHLYNYLRENDLSNPEKLLEYIYKSSQTELIDLCHEINSEIEKNSLKITGPAYDSIFNFTASPSSVGLHGPCIHPECKLYRVDDFINYALLYSDTVSLPNIFPTYFNYSELSHDQLTIFRADLFGNLLILIRLKDLFDANVAAFVPNTIGLCNSHGSLLENTWDQIENDLITSAKELTENIASSSTVLLYATQEGVSISASLPEEYFESSVDTIDPIPPNEKIKSFSSYKKAVKSGEPVPLTYEEIIEIGIIENRLLDILDWARIYLFSSIFMPSKFLTSKPSDALLLDNSFNNKNFKQSSKNIKDNIPLQMPILEGVNTESLIKVRKTDYDAFINFRKKIRELQKEFISSNGSITNEDAVKLYEDIIFPGIEEVDTKLKSLRRELRSDAFRKVSIVATFVTIGLSSGLIPNNYSTIIELAGACELIDSATNLWKSLTIPEEIKRDPFYFLWKVQRKSNH